MKCDKCDKQAVVHEVVIQKGVKQEVHLCSEHAAESGYVIQSQVTGPINQLLGQFMVSHAGKAGQPRKTCPSCGLTLGQFRKSGVLGCPDCYEAFEEQLDPIIQRAHAGATHHIGKSPNRAGDAVDRQMELRRLMRELDQAVAAEAYERAAEIRDRLMNLEPESGEGGRTGEPGGRGGRGGRPESSRRQKSDEAGAGPAASEESGQSGG